MWSSWSLCRVPSKRFLADSSASTMHAYFVLRVPEGLQVSPCLLLLILQGTTAGIVTSNFFSAFCDGFFELCICRINEVSPSQLFRIVELRFFDSPFLFFSLSCVWHIFPYFWPQVIWPGCCLLFCQPPPDHEHPSGGFSSNMVNCVKPVHASDRLRSPSTFQQSSMFRSNITSKVVLVMLATSIYRSRIGNDSSLGPQRLAPGSTCWR